MQLPYSEQLEVQYLTKLFENMSESYKLFWFKAIADEVTAGNSCPTYDKLLNNMIADAWYMVSEYRLNLGPSDTLEGLVHYVYQLSGLSSKEKKQTILDYLAKCNDKELVKRKRTLILNVPYRLQAPFMPGFRGDDWKVSQKELVERINSQKRLIYYFREFCGLQTQIKVQPEWADYLLKNKGIVEGWIQYHMILYLQRRNPSVPGISSKLSPQQERKLEKVQKFWRVIIELTPIPDIYAGEILTAKDVSIDHFVPWSYVAHDELWNLSPTTKSVNSRKGSNLPNWNRYFTRLCAIEYQSYELIWSHDAVHREFDKCQREHVNSVEIRHKLYRKGLERDDFYHCLEEIVTPVYHAAESMGFQYWELKRK